uniref:Putative ovule protein n=1 Tax=Solanum chacoense TaxID=4108 RepID=A0A0V0HDP5_SOLCH
MEFAHRLFAESDLTTDNVETLQNFEFIQKLLTEKPSIALIFLLTKRNLQFFYLINSIPTKPICISFCP